VPLASKITEEARKLIAAYVRARRLIGGVSQQDP
jgi:hypothetical protein